MSESNSSSDPSSRHDDPSSLPPVIVGPLELNDEAAQETPRPIPLPYRKRPVRPHDEDGSRELMLGWCLWLLASWVMLGGGFNGTPIRQMVFASCIGMMIVWPAYRLSQSGSRREPPANETERPVTLSRAAVSHLTPGLIFRDWFALNGVFQAVIWPHLITKHWSFEQAAWVSGSVAAWSLLIGAVVAWGCRSLSWLGRSMAMLLVLAILFAEPVVLLGVRLIWPGSGPDHVPMHYSMHITPIEALYELTAAPTQFSARGWGFSLVFVLLAAVLSWAGVLRMKRR